MLGSGLIKFFGAILLTIVLIVIISFIGDKSLTAKDLTNDAVIISEVIAKAGINNTETPAQESITELLANADIKRGKKLSKKCATCHTLKKGQKNKTGPNLWNIIGSPKATKDGFKYSKALTALDGEWDYNSINEFITKPKKYAPGTKMSFAGLKKLKDRANLIAWLRLQAETPVDLPQELPSE